MENWKKGSLIWSTQFNDLRLDSLGQDPEAERIKLRRELKILALFQFHAVIRDTDIVNHPVLQRMLVDQESGLQTAIIRGCIVPNIRDSAASYSEVNEQIGDARAFPDRYLGGRDLLKQFDAFVQERSIPVAVNRSISTGAVFRKLLGRILNSPELHEPQKELLASAVDFSDTRSDPKLLRFGYIYEYLVKWHALAPESDLIQWCRTAHALALPSEMGLPTSTLDYDLSPSRVGVVLAAEGPHLDDASRWLEFYPKKNPRRRYTGLTRL